MILGKLINGWICLAGYEGFFGSNLLNEERIVLVGKLCRTKNVQQISITCKFPQISLLQAQLSLLQDALLFAKVELGECRKIMEILDLYGNASGQTINFDKSGIFFSSNMRPIERQLICSLLNTPPLKADAKYLGLPSCWGRSRSEALMFLNEQAMKNMIGWKMKTINQAGKETLIKSVVQGIPTYAMACFLLPKSTLNKFNSMIRNYWWKGDPENRGINWVSWDNLANQKWREAWALETSKPLMKQC